MLKGMKAKRQLAAFVALAVGGAFAGAPAAQAAERIDQTGHTVQTGDKINGADGTFSKPYGNISGTALIEKNPTTNNKLTITSGNVGGSSLVPIVIGDVSAGGTEKTSTAVTGNTLVLNSVLLQGNAYGGIGANNLQESGKNGNQVVLDGTVVRVDGTVAGSRSTGGGASRGTVDLKNGTVRGTVAGGYGKSIANDNHVNITGGMVVGTIYGGYAENAAAQTTGNYVSIDDAGDANKTYTADLTHAALYGGNKADNDKNHLEIRTKGITAKSARNFNFYDFHLDTGIQRDDTLLTLTDSDALGRAVSINEVTLKADKWSGKSGDAGVDPESKKYYGRNDLTLIRDGNTTAPHTGLRINGDLTGEAKESGDYEYRISADAPEAGRIKAELHRYRNADAIHDGAAIYGNEVHGGYSTWLTKDVQDNELTITNAEKKLQSDGRTYKGMTAYGGYTSTGANAKNNQLTFASGEAAALYGAAATGAGTVEKNTATITGGIVTGEVYGGRSEGTGAVTGNTVTVKKGVVQALTGGSGTTTVSDNHVNIEGDLVEINDGVRVKKVVTPTVNGEIRGGAISGDNTAKRTATKNTVKITEGVINGIVRGVFGDFFDAGGSTGTEKVKQTVSDNHVDITGGKLNGEVYGAYLTNLGTASGNTVTVSGNAEIGRDLIGAGAGDIGSAELTDNRVTVNGGSLLNVYGAQTKGTGALTKNTVTINGGTVHDNVYGGVSKSTDEKAGIVRENTVTVSGGTIEKNVYGGVTYSAALTEKRKEGDPVSGENTVKLEAGTINGDVYGGYAHGKNKEVEQNNTVQLGADDGSKSPTFGNVNIYGGATEKAGNTLQVSGSNITVKGVHNFDNYKFTVGQNIADGATMLTLTDRYGFDHTTDTTPTVDFKKITVDLKTKEKATDQIEGTVTLLQGAHDKALGFANYPEKPQYEVSDDYEYKLETDTQKAEGRKLSLTYNRFRNGMATYDATKTTKIDWFGGVSYDKQTTENNQLTIAQTLHANITAYGGKTLGTEGGSGSADEKRGNRLVINYKTGTNPAYLVTAGYGGYIGNAANTGTVQNNTVKLTSGAAGKLYGGYTLGTGAVTGNTVTVEGGMVTDVYGGRIDNAANGVAVTGTVNVSGGTVTNVYGGSTSGTGAVTGTVNVSGGTVTDVYGGAASGTGAVSGSNVHVTAGTVTGSIYAGTAASKGKAKDNTITLGAKNGDYAADLTNAALYGANDEGDGTGNKLVVQAKNTVTVKSVKNFQQYRFILQEGRTAGQPLLTVREGSIGGGDWKDVELSQPANYAFDTTQQGGYRNLMLLSSAEDFTFTNYAGKDLTDLKTQFERYVRTNTETADGKGRQILLTDTRLKDGALAYDGTNAALVGDEVFAGRSAMGYDLTNNTLKLTGVQKDGIRKFAAAAVAVGKEAKTGQEGKLENNRVEIDSAQKLLIKNVYGAYAAHTENKFALKGNHVTLTKGDLTGSIYGGYTAGTGEVSGSVVTLNGGSVTGSVYGGYSVGGAASGNKLTVGAVRITGNVTGGQGAGAASKNALAFSKATISGDVVGGYSGAADATGNELTLKNTTVGGSLTGSHANTAGAASSTMTLADAKIGGKLIGAFSTSGAASSTMTLQNTTVGGDLIGGQGATAAGSVISLTNTQIKGSLYGGRLADGKASTGDAKNVLNIYDFGSTAKDFLGVQTLNFYLSEADRGRSMLTLTAGTDKDMSTTKVGTLEFSGAQEALRNGDAVSLVKIADGKALKTADPLAYGTFQVKQGVTLNYNVTLEKRGANELVARIHGAAPDPQTKSLVETQAASIAFLGSGSDLLTDVGIPAAETAATQIADIVDTPYAGSEKNSAASAPLSTLGSYQLFAAQSFGSMRLKSGSYVDTKGWNLNVGYARRNDLIDRSVTFGPFVEYGRGSYDSYLDDGTHGSGKTDYLGAGIMAKTESENGLYVEGSLRVGRAKSDYSGSIGEKSTGYDLSSTYFAGHLGVGQKTELANGSKIDTYAKYFYAHQEGTSATLSTGETYDFGASTSSRIRLGTRYTVKNDLNGEFYAGLAWEYEFDGKGSATYQGFDLPSTSLKGSTALLELGYRFAPVDSTVSYGLDLTGFQGKRKGVTGGFNIAWAF